MGSSRRLSCCCWSLSRGCSPLPHKRSAGQGTQLCVRAEPSLAQGVGDRPDERRGGLCNVPSPPPGPVRPSDWCRQGNDTTWGWLSRCGDDFHGTMMTSTTRRRSAVALTSGDGFHGTTTASGGVDQWQWLPRHGEGQRWCRLAATASTSWRRPAAASTSGNGFHVTAKASDGVDQRQPDNGGLGSGPHEAKSGFRSFFYF
jgi:hypothetical protein